MRISDWSSDVCSSDLLDPLHIFDGKIVVGRRVAIDRRLNRHAVGGDEDVAAARGVEPAYPDIGAQAPAILVGDVYTGDAPQHIHGTEWLVGFHLPLGDDGGGARMILQQIGRASCRERVFQYV